MDATEPGYVEGTFWQLQTPDRRARGRLKLTGTDLPLLVVDGPIFDERSSIRTVSPTGMTIAVSGDPHDLVADFQPRTIHGELTTGVAISAIDAQGVSRGLLPGLGQQFRCRRVVTGAHVDRQQVYAATRFWLAESYRLPVGEAVTSDGGVLRVLPVDQADTTQWIEFQPAQPATLNHFDVQVMNPIITLYSLGTDNLTDHRDVHVRQDKDSPWMQVYEGVRDVGHQGHDLIATRYLTPEIFVRWIDLRTASDGLDAAVVDEPKGVTIQMDVLALSAVAEGLHRKLFSDPAKAKRLPAVSDKICDSVREAARGKAIALLAEAPFTDDDRTQFAQAVTDALSRLNDRTFRSRMQDLVDIAEHAVPGITGSFKDWPAAVRDARNTLAHRGTESLGVFETFLELLIALKYSMRWVLRTVLLDRAGIDPSAIRDGYRDSSAYGLHLANVRHHLIANGSYATFGPQAG